MRERFECMSGHSFKFGHHKPAGLSFVAVIRSGAVRRSDSLFTKHSAVAVGGRALRVVENGLVVVSSALC